MALPARRRRSRPLARLVCGRGRTLGLGIVVVSLVVLLVVLVAGFLATFDVHLGDGIDERTFAPASVDDLRGEYELGIGELVFDLRSVEFPLGETTLDVRVDAGRIHVLLSDDVAVRAAAEAKLGEIDLLGRHGEGWEADEQVDETGTRVLVLDASIGIGEIEVERSLR